jgi:hypothetical protein
VRHYDTIKGLPVIKKFQARLGKGFVFHQEPYFIPNTRRKANLYWVEANKKDVLFSLVNKLEKKALLDFALEYQRSHPKRKMLGAVNLGAFYLDSSGLEPKCSAYNAMVKNGKIFQYPSNTRVALVESKGQIRLQKINAFGELRIGKVKLKWAGSNYLKNDNDTCVIYGSFDIPIFSEVSKFGKVRINKEGLITPGKDEVLLGCNFRNKKIVIDVKEQKTLNIINFLFIIKGKINFLKDIKRGDIIEEADFNNLKLTNENITSLSFSLPTKNNKTKIKEYIKEELTTVNGKYLVLDKNYHKTWLSILETEKNGLLFLMMPDH